MSTSAGDRVAGPRPAELVMGRSLSREIAKKAAHVKSVTLTPHTTPDDYGRQQFTADWINEAGRKRGQVFRTELESTAALFRDAGYVIYVLGVQP